MEIGAAIDAVVRYAVEVAGLPEINAALLDLDAADTSRIWLNAGASASVLKPLVTDVIAGEVLPRVHSTWLVMTPFEDMAKRISVASKRDWTQKRREFLNLLATLACSSSSPFQLNALSSIRQRGGAEPLGNEAGSFWTNLMRALDPGSDDGSTDSTARCLIAMSHARSLRIMLCVTQETVPTEFADLLDLLLEPLTDAASVKRLTDVLAACGVMSMSDRPVTVDIGLSFPRAKISPAFMAKLLDVLHRRSSLPGVAGQVTLRVTSLRFGPGCVIQPKAIGVLGQRQAHSPIADLRLASPQGIKPASLRLSVTGMLKQQHGLQRLSLTSTNAFVAVASTLRSSDTSIEKLECAYEPTAESAAWLAFALFHVDSRSHVSSLRLRFPLRKHIGEFAKVQEDEENEEWLTAFKRALRSTTADHDLACLEGGDDQGEQEPSARRFVKIEAGTPVRLDPYASGKIGCKVDDTFEAAEAIATVNKSVAVIVPGLGVGWVPATSVTSEKFVATRLRTGSRECQVNRRITSLVWDCRTTMPFLNRRPFDGPVRLLMEILRIVGEPLMSLHIPKLRLTTDELAQVLVFCPNLTDLNISGHAVTTIAPLVDAYATGRCKIQTLSLVRTGDQNDIILQELSALLDGPHSLRLRRLGVHLTSLIVGRDTSSTIHRNATLALVRSLRKCHTLECVRVFGSLLWASGQQLSPPDVTIDVSAHPLSFSHPPIGTKLAFLSCVDNEHSVSALRRLDALVLAQIFRFSGRVVARQVLTGAPAPQERDA